MPAALRRRIQPGEPSEEHAGTLRQLHPEFSGLFLSPEEDRRGGFAPPRRQ